MNIIFNLHFRYFKNLNALAVNKNIQECVFKVFVIPLKHKNLTYQRVLFCFNFQYSYFLFIMFKKNFLGILSFMSHLRV